MERETFDGWRFFQLIRALAPLCAIFRAAYAIRLRWDSKRATSDGAQFEVTS